MDYKTLKIKKMREKMEEVKREKNADQMDRYFRSKLKDTGNMTDDLQETLDMFNGRIISVKECL